MFGFMPTDQNQNSTVQSAVKAMLPQVPSFPSGDEIYDGIMRSIEPDLTTSQLPLLSQKYQNENPGEAKIRSDRYTRAFAEYDRRYAAFTVQLESAVHTYQKIATTSVEEHSKMKEEQDLSNLEQSMSAS